jgi:hypothetical protein
MISKKLLDLAEGAERQANADYCAAYAERRVSNMTEFKGPIVEGDWYETKNHLELPGLIHRVTFSHGIEYQPDGSVTFFGQRWPYRLTRRVYITHTDPADVVAELRQCELGSSNPYMAGMAVGYHNAADLVAEKLVKP